MSTVIGNRSGTLSLLAALVLLSLPARPGEVDVVDAKVRCSDGRCNVAATLRHDDAGWDHYADHWRVLSPEGEEIARRVLYHPHVNEQPFTRSLGGIAIPPAADRVTIEAHDNVHGYGGDTLTLDVP